MAIAENSPFTAAEIDRVLSCIDQFKLVTKCRNLLKIPSYSGQETAKAQYVAKEMGRAGLEVIESLYAVDRPNVMGVLRGDGTGRSLMLAAHLDTYFPVEGQEEIQHSAKVEDGKIYGIGAGDSMGPMAAFFGVVDAIRRSGVKLRGDLIVSTTVDEMVFDEGAHLLLDSGLKPDLCIVGEPVEGLNIGTVHTGKVELEIKARGHSPAELGGYAEAAGLRVVNAVISMSNIIQKLLEMNRVEPYFQVTHPLLPGKGAKLDIGPIIGGSSGYGSPLRRPGKRPDQLGVAKMTPTWCYLKVRAWYWPGQTADEFLDLINKYIARAKEEDPNIEATVDVHMYGKMYDWIEVKEDSPAVQVLRKSIKHVMGREPKLVGNLYCTEAPQYHAAGIPVAWTGPGTLRFGSAGEHIEIAELVNLCKIYTTAALLVCG